MKLIQGEGFYEIWDLWPTADEGNGGECGSTPMQGIPSLRWGSVPTGLALCNKVLEMLRLERIT